MPLDQEMIARYEWAKRAAWVPTPRNAPLNVIFQQLLKEHAATTCLYSGGIFGRGAVALAARCPELGFIIHLPSQFGVMHGREITGGSSAAVFTSGAKENLASLLPYAVSAIVSPDWMLEPDFAVLKAHFCGAFQALLPGGWLAFPAPRRDGDWQNLLAGYDQWEDETVLWQCRDGGRTTICIRQKLDRAIDYADLKYLYLTSQSDGCQLETTTRRLPAYWRWSNVEELAQNAGFAAPETRDLPAALGNSTLVILRKVGNANVPAAPHAQERPYADF
jgi:hypothetical protein